MSDGFSAEDIEVSDARATHARLIRLRWPGSCGTCGKQLEAGVKAWHDPAVKIVHCIGCCSDGPEAASHAAVAAATDPAPPGARTARTDRGTAGASAGRTYGRRSRRHATAAERAVAADVAWRRQLKSDHPLLGRVVSAFTAKPSTAEPQAITAWIRGAEGEQKVGRRLNDWADAADDRFVLHDRRIPGSRANIDHIAIGPSGIWVIDAKCYEGKVEVVNVGGVFHPDVRLRVAGRDRSKLVDGVLWQMDEVAEVLDRGSPTMLPLHGVLCFVGAEWSVFSKPSAVRGVHVAWPVATVELISRSEPGPERSTMSAFEALARALRPA